MGDARPGITMPIASPGPKQAEADGDIGEPRSQIGVMAGVSRLYRVQSFAFETLDESPGATFLEMGYRDQAARAMDYFSDGAELRQRLLDESRPAAPDEPIKSIVRVDGPPVPHDRPRHVRPSDRAPGRFLKHAVE